MSIDVIIIYIMVIFMVIGGIDKCLGNKFGYGEKFEEVQLQVLIHWPEPVPEKLSRPLPQPVNP